MLEGPEIHQNDDDFPILRDFPACWFTPKMIPYEDTVVVLSSQEAYHSGAPIVGSIKKLLEELQEVVSAPFSHDARE